MTNAYFNAWSSRLRLALGGVYLGAAVAVAGVLLAGGADVETGEERLRWGVTLLWLGWLLLLLSSGMAVLRIAQAAEGPESRISPVWRAVGFVTPLLNMVWNFLTLSYLVRRLAPERGGLRLAAVTWCVLSLSWVWGRTALFQTEVFKTWYAPAMFVFLAFLLNRFAAAAMRRAADAELPPIAPLTRSRRIQLTVGLAVFFALPWGAIYCAPAWIVSGMRAAWEAHGWPAGVAELQERWPSTPETERAVADQRRFAKLNLDYRANQRRFAQWFDSLDSLPGIEHWWNENSGMSVDEILDFYTVMIKQIAVIELPLEDSQVAFIQRLRKMIRLLGGGADLAYTSFALQFEGGVLKDIMLANIEAIPADVLTEWRELAPIVTLEQLELGISTAALEDVAVEEPFRISWHFYDNMQTLGAAARLSRIRRAIEDGLVLNDADYGRWREDFVEVRHLYDTRDRLLEELRRACDRELELRKSSGGI